MLPQRSRQIRPMAVTPKPANGSALRTELFITCLPEADKKFLASGRRARAYRFWSAKGSRRRTCGNVGIAPLAISKRGGKSGKPGCGFPRFPRRGISTGSLGYPLYPPTARPAFQYVAVVE